MTSSIRIAAKSGLGAGTRSGCLVVGVFENDKLTHAATELDRASRGQLRAIVRRGDIEGRIGQTLLLQALDNVPAQRVLVVGCGVARELTDARYRRVLAAAAARLMETGSSEVVSFLSDLPVPDLEVYWKVRLAVEATREARYRFDDFKSKRSGRAPSLKRMTLAIDEARQLPAAERALHDGAAIANGIDLAKDLANTPPNICHPTYLANRAKELARRHRSLKVSVLEAAQMRRLGMHTLLAVARGSHQPPRLIVFEYKGARGSGKPIALVGKGVTFDTGGISIKPAAAMDEMKFDMCGAASVFGTMSAVAEMKLPLHVVAAIPAVENMPGGNATRPADIVTSLSGQTVEILNTDAEGRLILCDAITYIERRYAPQTVVDIATLTGACVIALGNHATGLFSNHQPLADALLAAGQAAGDRAWQLPLWEEYQSQLDSPFADMANVGGREGGAITAACFLSRFARKLQWAHLDIAGTAYRSGKQKGATGRPVPLLTQFLLDRAGRSR
ncbi:MAG: Cytosol aminopeptidase [Gammaproteobacteria bacterium]|nr:Cytosol aminopeptidase [Gammaproteobacteria bacterium]